MDEYEEEIILYVMRRIGLGLGVVHERRRLRWICLTAISTIADQIDISWFCFSFVFCLTHVFLALTHDGYGSSWKGK